MGVRPYPQASQKPFICGQSDSQSDNATPHTILPGGGVGCGLPSNVAANVSGGHQSRGVVSGRRVLMTNKAQAAGSNACRISSSICCALQRNAGQTIVHMGCYTRNCQVDTAVPTHSRYSCIPSHPRPTANDVQQPSIPTGPWGRTSPTGRLDLMRREAQCMCGACWRRTIAH